MTAGAVAVTGLGVLSPAGVDVEETWRGVCAGEQTAVTDPLLAELPAGFSCRVPDLHLTSEYGRRRRWRLDRCSQLAISAAEAAGADAGLEPGGWDAARVGVVLGTSLGGAQTWETQHRKFLSDGPRAVSAALLPMVMPNMPAGEVAIALDARGPGMAVCTACASGGTALATAREWLLAGACDVVLAGGAEAAVTPLVAAGFQRVGALSRRASEPAAASRPFAADRDGFVLGEGAGVLVLERLEHARARGATPRALLAGAGTSTDAHHPTTPSPEGRVAEAAVREALASAGVTAADVDHVNAHGTSTPVGDAAEAALLARVFPQLPSTTSAKGSLGHPLGAAGAVEAALTVLTLQYGLVPPTANVDAADPELEIDLVTKVAREQRVEVALSNSFGFGGQNAALVLARA
ncbi:beta-ketoacyl-[acyl-carrier-protein] synthase family protein [Streptomyces xiaopingdaonensis]|uniref:beta-ketoacyl-[acyl-carrier-protein] synthase family protein n=1 Tax=Streptomyces xiaopingdaonensis TaxID=1565415 RepID=UPI00031C67C2|nr:beta-ketoacyl-[acyl-carrier-protein] synthase family protein [Streptomyces xiaopingdaonensis]